MNIKMVSHEEFKKLYPDIRNEYVTSEDFHHDIISSCLCCDTFGKKNYICSCADQEIN